MTNNTQEKIHSRLFPVKRSESKKLLALCCYKALASFIYAILKALKNPFIATAEDSTAEAIGIIKGFIVVPVSVLFVLVYGFCLNRYAPKKIFYGIMCFFIGYFLLYSLFLYPYADSLKPSEHAASLLRRYPAYQHVWAVYHHWMDVTFFLMAELWAQIIIVLLFFSIVNEIYTYETAKRLYHLLIVGGYLGGLFGTFYMNLMNYIYPDIKEALPMMFKAIILVACVLLLFYHWLDHNFFEQSNLNFVQRVQKEQRLSLWESIRHLAANKRLFAVAVIVLGSNLATNLVDLTYEANLKELYPNLEGNLKFGISVLQLSILSSILLGFFVSGNVIRKWGWKVTAYVMPATVFFTGSLFLLSSTFKDHLTFLEALGCTPLQFVVYLGAIQHIIWKIAEYVFFDATREMAYINLEPNAKRKGKAAIDLVGSRVGKALSSCIHTLGLALATTSSVLDITLPLFGCFLIVCIAWGSSVRFLGEVIAFKNDQKEPTKPKENKKDSGQHLKKG